MLCLLVPDGDELSQTDCSAFSSATAQERNIGDEQQFNVLNEASRRLIYHSRHRYQSTTTTDESLILQSLNRLEAASFDPDRRDSEKNATFPCPIPRRCTTCRHAGDKCDSLAHRG